MHRLRSTLSFFGTYAVFSATFTLLCFIALAAVFVHPNEPDLGKAAAGGIAFVLSPIIGMALALIVMYFFERRLANGDE